MRYIPRSPFEEQENGPPFSKTSTQYLLLTILDIVAGFFTKPTYTLGYQNGLFFTVVLKIRKGMNQRDMAYRQPGRRKLRFWTRLTKVTCSQSWPLFLPGD